MFHAWLLHGCCTTCLHTFQNWVEKQLSWSFYTLVCIRSANCQAISTEANSTQVCPVWRPQRHRTGSDLHSEGIEILQWNSNLICSFSKSLVDAYLVQCGEVCSWCRCTSSRSVSVVCLDYKECTLHHLSNVCMRMTLHFAVCVGCADTPQGVTGGSDTTWACAWECEYHWSLDGISERCVVSIISMCVTPYTVGIHGDCSIGIHSCICMSTACCTLQFVLILPSRPSPWPFGGFPCGLSEVDLFGAGKGHPVPSELIVSSEGAAQPEGTQTGGPPDFVEWESECLSLSYMNCRQSVAVVEVFNMSYSSIVFGFSHSLIQMSLHHQWSTTPVWGSWLLKDSAVGHLSRELWRGWQGDMVWRNWLLLQNISLPRPWCVGVSVFSALSFHSILRHIKTSALVCRNFLCEVRLCLHIVVRLCKLSLPVNLCARVNCMWQMA